MHPWPKQSVTVAVLLQANVEEAPPELTVTLPLFVPMVEYTLVTLAPVPERPSVPLQEYVYEPEPPLAVELQVNDAPINPDDGDTEQEPVMDGFVTVTEPEPDTGFPAAFTQVNVHVAEPADHERGPEL